MPTLMVTETTETTYFKDGSAKEKKYLETDTVKNSEAFESEEETITFYGNPEKAEIIMLEADAEFLDQEADALEAA